MRIAMIASPFLPVPPQKYGGTERVVYYLIKGLMEQNHKVTLFACGDSQVNCELISIVDKPLFFGKTKEEQKKLEKKVKNIDKKISNILEASTDRFDIVHSHGFDLKGLNNLPNVTTLHGKFTLEYMKYFEKRMDLNYVSISDNQRDSFPELNYVGTAYNGLDPEEFPFISKPSDYVCFLGRLDREKNPHLALQLAINAGIKIKIAGKIDFQGNGYIQDEIEPYLDHPLVEYLGEIGMEEKIDLLGNAMCNLHPTGFREPFGLTVLEAAYCGTPTLAIAMGSMPELIEEGRTGFLVEDFAEGYHYLKDCMELDRNYISTRAKNLFNYKNMTNQYLSAYSKAIETFKLENRSINDQVASFYDRVKSQSMPRISPKFDIKVI